MRRGCISLGTIKCDDCKRSIPYPERYLLTEDKDGVSVHLCSGCCLDKGLAKFASKKDGSEVEFIID